MAKESSDMFPPLKAVAGALSVLIKNYDVSALCSSTGHFLILYPILLQQTSDNAQMVKEIEKRVQSLSGVLASPASEDDYAERGRRLELRRFELYQYVMVCSSPSQEAPGSCCRA